MKKFLLLSLLAALAVVAWQFSEPLMAQAPAQQEPNRQQLISVIEQSDLPQNEKNQRIAAANQIWDAAEAKGLDNTIASRLTTNLVEKNISVLPGYVAAVPEVLNNVDLSNAPISQDSKGLILGNLVIAQDMKAPPDKINQMATTLVGAASSPQLANDENVNLNKSVLGTIAGGMLKGLSEDQAMKMGGNVIIVSQQLVAQGNLTNDQISNGVTAAMNSVLGNATPEEALQVANASINAIGGGASEAATFTNTNVITAAVQTGGDVQTVTSTAVGTADEIINAQQSTVAGQVGGNTAGQAALQGIPVDTSREMGLQAGERTAQLQQQFGDLAAVSAAPTLTDGLINQQNPELLDTATNLAATTAVQIRDNGGSPLAMQVAGEIAGGGILAGQNEQVAAQSADIGVVAFNNQVAEGGGTLAATQAATTAATTFAELSGTATNQETPPQAAEKETVPQQEVPAEGTADENPPPLPVGADQNAPGQVLQQEPVAPVQMAQEQNFQQEPPPPGFDPNATPQSFPPGPPPPPEENPQPDA